MKGVFSRIEDKFSGARNKIKDFVHKERTINVSESLINQLIRADEKLFRKMSSKGLNGVNIGIDLDKMIITGQARKQDENLGFKAELYPEKVVWTRDVHAVYLKILDYDLSIDDPGYFEVFKLAIIKTVMAIAGENAALEHIGVQMEDGLIKVDIKSSGQGVKKLAGSFQVKEIRCLPGKLAVKVLPFSSGGR